MAATGQIRSQFMRRRVAGVHPPPPTGHEPLGRTVSADIAITAFEPDMHALAGNGSMTRAV